VRIQLGNESVKIAESYEVAVGIFTQPSAFALTLGHNEVVSKIIQKAKPRTPFKLFINDRLVQQGYVDGYSYSGTYATLRIRGRDFLQDLHDSEGGAIKTYTSKTYKDLVREVLFDAGLKDVDLTVSNAANRLAIAKGKNGIASTEAGPKRTARPATHQIGETYWSFIKRHLDRAGLFLFAAPGSTRPSFVLAKPDASQAPLYPLVHGSSDPRVTNNVTGLNFTFETTGRAVETIVYARGGGKKQGRVKIKARGDFFDGEMLELGYKDRVFAIRDQTVVDDEQAAILSRRRIAEQRRRSWVLEVDVAGHTTTGLDGFSPTVWTPDTMVSFTSEQLGLKGNYYIESVVYRRDQSTTTTLRLMRPEDLEFGQLADTD
jgi:prophage tail gpP-like protein